MRLSLSLGGRGACRLFPVFLMMFTWSAKAAPIDVNNASFERANYPAGATWTNDLTDPEALGPNWIGRDGVSGVGDTFVEIIPGFAAAGTGHLGMQNNYYVFQNTGVPYEPNTRYVLTVAVGNRNDDFSPDGSLSIVGLTVLDEAPSDDNRLPGANANAQLDADPLLMGNHQIVDSGLIPTGSFEDVVVEFVTDDTPPTGNIVVFLGDDVSADRSHFDNVRLEAFGNDLIVDLYAAHLDDGAVTSWENQGSLGGTFAATGDPTVQLVDRIKAVHLDGEGDWLVGPTAPESVTGSNPRTIEAWIHNFTVQDEETVFAWGRRGGPDGSNVSFNHGAHDAFGAVGHWGAPDIGWANEDEPDIWTHIAYTQDGSETRVYTNGQLVNAEAGITLNTHSLADDGTTPLPFVVGNQNEPNGTQVDPLSGSLSISKLRVFDRALSEEEILANYQTFAAGFGRDVYTPDADDDGDGLLDGLEMLYFGTLRHSGEDDSDGDGLSNSTEIAIGTNPASRDSDGDGALDGAEVAAGSDPNNGASVPPSNLEVLVSLDATNLPDGALMEWANAGSVGGTFVAAGDPAVEEIDGARGVTLDGDGDWLVGPVAPETVTGSNPRSVEAWIFNPEAAVEETVFAWGRRGGPDGTNVSFNHGTHDAFGAVGHWGNGPDIGWDPTADDGDDPAGDDQEVTGRWTHIAYTQSGSETRVYTDGVLTKSEVVNINTHTLADDGTTPLPFVVGNQNEPNGTQSNALTGSLSICSVRVYAGVLTEDNVRDIFNLGAPSKGLEPVPPPALVDLDSRDFPGTGPLSGWDNEGTLGGSFTSVGDPMIEDVDGVRAVTLDGDGDWLVGPIAPTSVTGSRARTVEAWIKNPAIADEETVFAWGRRGGPDGSNVSFNHGAHDAFGAVGHWGAPDIGWNDEEEADIWTYIAYTQNGSETKVYTNGLLSNSEAGITLNTHTVADDGTTPLPFLVGNQNEPDGTQTNALVGSMSIAVIRVYEAALTETNIAVNYNEDAEGFGRDTFVVGADEDMDGLPDDYEQATFGNLDQDGAGDFDEDGLTNLEEFHEGTNPTLADSDRDGFGDKEEIDAGSDPLSAASFPDVEPDLVVLLDASGLDEGAIASWTNTGTLGGEFVASGDPMVETITGAKGVTLDGDGDWFTGPVSTPRLEGASARTVEAWIYNPEVASEETVVAWARRGGPDGTNVSFNHGTHDAFGAVGHWGNGPDIGWDPTATDGDDPAGDDQEEAGIWTHITYTYNGQAVSVYTNGLLTKSESPILLNSHAGQAILIGAQWENATTVNTGLLGSLSVGMVRIYDGALSDAEIAANFNATAAAYGRAPIPLLEAGTVESVPGGMNLWLMRPEVVLTPEGAQLAWPSIAGAFAYQIEYSQSLEPGSWQVVDELPGAGVEGMMNFIDETPGRHEAPSGFYRLRVQLGAPETSAGDQ